jgi:hypothetical protein
MRTRWFHLDTRQLEMHDKVRWGVVLHAVPYIRGTPKEVYNLKCLVPTERGNTGEVLWWFRQQYRLICCKRVRGQDARSHPMIQTLFPNNEAAFQEDNSSIHTAETVQSGFEDHEDKFQHLPRLVSTIILNSMVWDRERTIPTERPPLVGEVIVNFCGSRMPRGQRDGSLRPCSRLSRHDPATFLSSTSSVVITGLSGPRSRPTTFL